MINILGFLTDKNKSVLVSLVLFLPVTYTPRAGLDSRTWSVFVFLCFSRLYTDSRVEHPRLDRQNDTLPEWLRGSPAK